MKVSDNIESLVPYVPGKPIAETKREYNLDQVIKLASNENALGPSPKAVEALQKAIKDIHIYPDAGCYELKTKFSERLNLDPSMISFGNGSNEIIDLLIRLFCVRGDKILTGKSAFIAYKICAQVSGVTTDEIPLKSNMQFDIPKFKEFIENSWSEQHKLVFLPNPNNPTGTYISKREMDEFVEYCSTKENLTLIFDEAYNEFVRATDYPDALSYLKKYDNVIIMRTLSKVYGLGGLRLGLLLAKPKVIEYFNRIRNPFNVNSLAQAAALAAMDDHEYLVNSQEIVWSGLDYFYDQFQKMDIEYTPSQGNFVLFNTRKNGSQVALAALKKGVILRPIGGYGLPEHLRMSIGLPHENQRAIEVLKELL